MWSLQLNSKKTAPESALIPGPFFVIELLSEIT